MASTEAKLNPALARMQETLALSTRKKLRLENVEEMCSASTTVKSCQKPHPVPLKPQLLIAS